MKTLLIALLLTVSTSASAYCVHYDFYGKCDRQDDYTVNNPGYTIKPLPVIPPLGMSSCEWVMINNQWQSVCH